MPEPISAFRLDGRAALVTGAARGIGAEIARVLAGLGAAVARADVLPDSAWESGPPGPRLALDVGDTAACEGAADRAAAALGGLDLLVNNAGVNAYADAEATDDATWERVIDVNLTGAFRMSRAAYRHLSKRTPAAVVNIVSTLATKAIKRNVPYGVSKAGLVHLTRVLALEWADRGIRVNAVAPTIVPTEMTADIRANEPYVAERMAGIPLGRFASTTDIANAVAFLASTAAGMVTGHVLAVDGGVLTQ
jgi:NAD(P)-dependent dehydrogenase (short-subunit alcohol dehydrogenase family)